MLYDKTDLQQLKEKNAIYNPKEARSTLFIPTGIFIENIKWESNHDFRNTIQSASFIYLELLYFLMYMVMPIVTMIATSSMIKDDMILWRVRLDRITKMSYWPLLLVTLELATVLVFY